jgi:hypothetical protein
MIGWNQKLFFPWSAKFSGKIARDATQELDLETSKILQQV